MNISIQQQPIPLLDDPDDVNSSIGMQNEIIFQSQLGTSSLVPNERIHHGQLQGAAHQHIMSERGPKNETLRYGPNHYNLIKQMEKHPTKHITELKLVSLLSQHKLNLKENLRLFPPGQNCLLNDSKDLQKFEFLETIGSYDPDDKIALVDDYEQILKQLDQKMGNKYCSNGDPIASQHTKKSSLGSSTKKALL